MDIKYTTTNIKSFEKLVKLVEEFSEGFKKQITQIEEDGFKLCKIHLGDKFSTNKNIILPQSTRQINLGKEGDEYKYLIYTDDYIIYIYDNYDSIQSLEIEGK